MSVEAGQPQPTGWGLPSLTRSRRRIRHGLRHQTCRPVLVRGSGVPSPADTGVAPPIDVLAGAPLQFALRSRPHRPTPNVPVPRSIRMSYPAGMVMLTVEHSWRQRS